MPSCNLFKIGGRKERVEKKMETDQRTEAQDDVFGSNFAQTVGLSHNTECRLRQ
jgi:hypothetical protein